MKNNDASKTSISQASSYEEAGEYWDEHDVGEIWEQTEAVEFEVDIQSSVTYFRIESTLAKQLCKLAAQRGVSSETLLNLWLRERIQREKIDVG